MERCDLERPMSLRRATKALDNFFNDLNAYPDNDFYLRKGVNKVFAEEFHPLVCLAQTFRWVRSVALSPAAHEGTDAEIRFWWRPKLRVQITCVHESYSRALMREQMANSEVVSPQSVRYRDKTTGEVKASDPVAVCAGREVEARCKRIMKAIESKQEKYHPGTDVLLVHDEPLHSHTEKESLHSQVVAALNNLSVSRYRYIYICYGETVKRAK